MSVKSLNEVLRRVNLGSRTSTRRSEGVDELPWADIKRELNKHMSDSQISQFVKDFDNPTDTEYLDIGSVVVAVEEIAGSSTADAVGRELMDYDESYARTRAGRRGRMNRRREEVEELPWADIKRELKKHLSDSQVTEVSADFDNPTDTEYLGIGSVIASVGDIAGSSAADKVEKELREYD
jgi:hypothetical protein